MLVAARDPKSEESAKILVQFDVQHLKRAWRESMRSLDIRFDGEEHSQHTLLTESWQFNFPPRFHTELQLMESAIPPAIVNRAVRRYRRPLCVTHCTHCVGPTGLL